jgi:hydrogenase maturation protease
VAELLAQDPSVTACAEVATAGTDLLRSIDRIAGRRRVILVDATECADHPGGVSIVDEPLLDEHTQYAHSLSAPHAVELMRRAAPGLRETKFTWVLVHVASVNMEAALSTEVAAALPVAAAAVKKLIGDPALTDVS